MPARRHSAGPLATSLVLLGGACVLVGTLGTPRLMGGELWLRWATTFDVLNNFLPLWALLIALGLMLALVPRRAPAGFIAGASVALTAALVPIGIELARMPERVPAGSGNGLRIIQFNAFNFNEELEAALALALYSDADLLFVQEPNRFRTIEPALRGAFPWQTPCPRSCDAVIYSRLPPLASDYETIRGIGEQAPDGADEGAIGVASMTLNGPDGAPFTAIATHFLWPFPPMPVLHQRDAFLNAVTRIDRSRAIVAGDFNLTPWTYEMRAFDAEIQPMQRMTRALFSFPTNLKSTYSAPFPLLPIDHVYAGPQWKLVTAERGPAGGSDHYSIIVDLIMPGE